LDIFEVPVQAISTFEKLTRLKVTIHDFSGSLRPFLAPEYFQHDQPLCLAVKASPYAAACHNLEIHRLRGEILNQSEGRIHLCHAGLVEWVVPGLQEGKLTWLLFAGQRTVSPGLTKHQRDAAPAPRVSPWPVESKLPPPVEDEEAALILESLRQLSARLQIWLAEARNFFLDTRLNDLVSPSLVGSEELLATRRTQIRRFIYYHHTEPINQAELAEQLCLSESRLRHVVKEVCGVTLTELILEARIRTAATLLSHSSLSVREVGLQSGFQDNSNFHRSFQKRMNMTPHKFRQEIVTI
jgi:AraC-like DNA-binding protein